MYDYIMVYSDDQYQKTIQSFEIEQFCIIELGLIPISKLKFYKNIDGEEIIVTGILANSNGGYAFDTLDDVEEINLIEIDIPDKLTYEIEKEILDLSNAIASKFSWKVDLRESDS